MSDEARTARAEAKAAKAKAKALRPWYKKKRFWLLGLIVVIVIIVVAASAGSKNNNGVSANSHPNTGCVSSPPTYPDHQSTDCVAPASGAVGIANATATAAWATATTELGTKVICATVSIKNHNTGTISYNDLYWKLQAPSGKVEDADFQTASGGTGLGSGDIVAGGSTSGQVCFDDPGQAGVYVGIYKPDPFQSNRGIWLFSAA
ncbi:MAG: DUF4352 domain-containing protein [Acidimicrobiales bacterium]